MRAEELKDILSHKPFDRVRLHMSSGEHVDITHPDAAIVTKSLVYVGIGVDEEGVADRTRWYNLPHIVKLERLDRQTPNGNGNHRRKRKK